MNVGAKFDNSKMKNLPKYIQQDNAKIVDQTKSLEEVFDEMMEKAKREMTSQVIELSMQYIFDSSHIILWIYLQSKNMYFSPSFGLSSPLDESNVALAFNTIRPMPLEAQNKSSSFVKGIDDRVIPANYPTLTIPILDYSKHALAVVQIARKHDKPFLDEDLRIADWLMKKFTIYGPLLFDDRKLLEIALGSTHTDSYFDLIDKLDLVLQKDFNCRAAEIWVRRVKKNEIYRVGMEEDNVKFHNTQPGCVAYSLLNMSIICEKSVLNAPDYKTGPDGCFDESVLVVPYVEKPSKIWAVVLRGNSLGFNQQDVSRLKHVIQFVIRSVRSAINAKKAPPNFDNCRNGLASLLDVAEELSGVLDLEKLIPLVMSKSCKLMNAERCSLFLLNPQTNDLVTFFQSGLQTPIRIKRNKGIVGTTATTGEIIIISDAYNDPRFDSSIDKKTGYVTRNIMSVPIYNSKGEITGVTELINKREGSFTSDDTKLMIGFNVFCGIAIDNAKLYSASIGLSKQVRSFFSMSEEITNAASMRTVVENILNLVMDISEAKRACLYLNDANDKITPLVTVGEHSETPSIIVRTVCLEMKPKILSAEDAEAMLTANGYRNNVRLAQLVSTRRSMKGDLPKPGGNLCFLPLIGSDNTILGTMEVEKYGKVNTEDLKLLECFAVFASAALERNQLKDISILGNNEVQLKQWISREERMLLDTIPSKFVIPNKLLSAIWTVNFDAGHWDDFGLFQVVFAIFHRFSLQQEFNIPNEKLFRFLVEVKNTYRDLPYHNWRHAVDVTQFVSYEIICSGLEDKLTKFDILSLIVASLCHDAGHDGFNNTYNVQAETPLGILFKNQSVLEMKHCEVTITIMSNDQCNILSELSLMNFKTVWNSIIQLILATDMAKHFDIVNDFNALLNNKFDINKPDTKILMMQMLIKAGDISNCSRPFDVADKWTDFLCEEFFHQGDLEKAKGMEYTSENNDREHLDKPKSQIGFYTSVCLPLFQAIAKVLPHLQLNANQVESNLMQWKRTAEDIKKQAELAALEELRKKTELENPEPQHIKKIRPKPPTKKKKVT